MQELRILIVDDEELARARLRDLLGDVQAEVPHVIVGEAGNGVAALRAIEATSADLLLLDIRMPGMNGIELARHLTGLKSPPAVIFTTAYDDHAMEAFELNAIDYLLKPVNTRRLAAALLKAQRLKPAVVEILAALPHESRTHLSCHERGRLLLVPVSDILYLKADLKYVTARTAEREYLLDESLVQLESEFGSRFIRLHRSVIVAREAIVGFERNSDEAAETQWVALVRNLPERLPVSRRQWPSVRTYAKQLSALSPS